jgi:hypothetical protein
MTKKEEVVRGNAEKSNENVRVPGLRIQSWSIVRLAATFAVT